MWALYVNPLLFATALSLYMADGLAKLNSAQTTWVMHRTAHGEGDFALNLSDINDGKFKPSAASHGTVSTYFADEVANGKMTQINIQIKRYGYSWSFKG